MSKKPKYITLGQFLKLSEYVSSGGEAKMRIHEFDITVNGEEENRRGKKLYDGDKVIINGDSHVIKHED